jgi:hypothetical protein
MNGQTATPASGSPRTSIAARSLALICVAASPHIAAQIDPAQATYSGILDDAVTLVDGRFEGAPFVADGASRPIVTMLDSPRASGDLDGDGIAEEAVILTAQSGGSGTFVYLAVLAEGVNAADNLATVYVGDRVRVIELDIDSGVISAKVVGFAPGDPMCCPSAQRTLEWQLVDGELAESGE